MSIPSLVLSAISLLANPVEAVGEDVVEVEAKAGAGAAAKVELAIEAETDVKAELSRAG